MTAFMSEEFPLPRYRKLVTDFETAYRKCQLEGKHDALGFVEIYDIKQYMHIRRPYLERFLNQYARQTGQPAPKFSRGVRILRRPEYQIQSENGEIGVFRIWIPEERVYPKVSRLAACLPPTN